MTNLKEDPSEALVQQVVGQLEDMKALDIKVIDVRGKTSITDFMIIATGTSTRHVKAVGDSVIIHAKQAGRPPIGTEGERSLDWMLVDLDDVIVHVMLAEARGFYNLEKLWETPPEEQGDAVIGAA